MATKQRSPDGAGASLLAFVPGFRCSSWPCGHCLTRHVTRPITGLRSLADRDSAERQPDTDTEHQGTGDPVHQGHIAALGEEVAQSAATARIEQQTGELYDQD